MKFVNHEQRICALERLCEDCREPIRVGERYTEFMFDRGSGRYIREAVCIPCTIKRDIKGKAA